MLTNIGRLARWFCCGSSGSSGLAGSKALDRARVLGLRRLLFYTSEQGCKDSAEDRETGTILRLMHAWTFRDH